MDIHLDEPPFVGTPCGDAPGRSPRAAFRRPTKADAQTLRAVLTGLRAHASDPEAVPWTTSVIPTPALIAAGRKTGIEANMLGKGLDLLLRDEIVDRGAIETLKNVIKTRSTSLESARRMQEQRGIGNVESAMAAAVMDANAAIRAKVDAIRHGAAGGHSLVRFALGCIDAALRDRAWVGGRYRAATWHPVDEILSPRERLDLMRKARERLTQPSADEWGKSEARYILHSLYRSLSPRGTSKANTGVPVRIHGWSKARTIKLGRVDTWWRRGRDSAAKRETTRSVLVALLKAAGAGTKAVAKIQNLTELTSGEVRSACGMFGAVDSKRATQLYGTRALIVGQDIFIQPPKSAPPDLFGRCKVEQILKYEPISKRDAIPTISGSTCRWYPTPVAFDFGAKSREDRGWEARLPPLLFNGTRHLPAPSAYFIQEEHRDAHRRTRAYRRVRRENLLDYLKQKQVFAGIEGDACAIRILADIHENVPQRRLRDVRAKSDADDDRRVRQGVALLRELKEPGVVRGAIDSDSLRIDEEGNLKLVDVPNHPLPGVHTFSWPGAGTPAPEPLLTPMAAYAWAHRPSPPTNHVDRRLAWALDCFCVAIGLLNAEADSLPDQGLQTVCNKLDAAISAISIDASRSPPMTREDAARQTEILNTILDSLQAAKPRIHYLSGLAKAALAVKPEGEGWPAQDDTSLEVALAAVDDSVA